MTVLRLFRDVERFLAVCERVAALVPDKELPRFRSWLERAADWCLRSESGLVDPRTLAVWSQRVQAAAEHYQQLENDNDTVRPHCEVS